MKMKHWTLFPAIALLLVSPGLAYDDEEYEPPEATDNVEFKTGYMGSSTDGALFKAAEYDVTDSSPLLGLTWTTSPYESTQYAMDVDWLIYVIPEAYAALIED